MSILLETYVLPETGRLTVSVQQDVQINISAAEAQRHVTQFVHRQISSQMHDESAIREIERHAEDLAIRITSPATR